MRTMTPKDLVKHYGSKRQAAIGIGVSRQTIYKWLEAGKVPERKRQMVAAKVGAK